jgi:pimeloyl-ACP methyl ester carboxylesterase
MSDTIFLSGQLCTESLWQHQRGLVATERMLTLFDHDTVAGLARSVLAMASQRVSLVAHGMAGFVAFDILRQQPERVEKLVLMSTLAPADTPKQTVRREGYLKLAQEGRFDGIIEERMPMLVHPDRQNDNALTAILRTMARDTGVEAFLRQQRAIMSRPDSRPGLPAIPCPVLLIYGRADGISTIEHQQEMLDAIPNAQLEIIETSGHMLPLERPDEVNALLRAFL